MKNELPFDGFGEFVRAPLEYSDPLSFKRIKRFFLDLQGPPVDPFAQLVSRIVGKPFKEHLARHHWMQILANKKDLEGKLGRPVSIQTAAVDYFSQKENGAPARRYPMQVNAENPVMPGAGMSDEWIHRVYSPGYHMDRMKHEIMRARRYNHALSMILLDIDEFHRINETISYEAGDEILKAIVRIIGATVRAVDTVARCGGDQFLIILPSTNKREALELTERLRTSIGDRTKLIPELPGGVSATFAVGQTGRDDHSQTFFKKLEFTLQNGKKKQRNAVHECPA